MVEGHLLGLLGSLEATDMLGGGIDVLVHQLLHARHECFIQR
jgi:hypothetical protein